MVIEQVWLQNVRNLPEQSLNAFAPLNWLQGDNGSGKTSFLESLYLLGNGRSFRTSTIERMITDGQAAVSVSGGLRLAGDEVRVGIRRSRDGATTLRINGQDEKRLSALASVVPVQALTPESYQLLHDSPRERRRFLDWIVFHVEHNYVALNAQYRRVLLQRNALLKQTITVKELDVWDQQLAEIGEQLDHARQLCWQRFRELLSVELLPLQLPFELQIDYFRGWSSEDASLLAALRQQRSRDFQIATTTVGPHKADIRVRAGRVNAAEKLSRGQSKVLVQALYITQLKLLMQARHHAAVLLLDDMGAELDVTKQEDLIAQAMSLSGVQLFVSSTLPCPEAIRKRYNTAMFHVEHGVITPVLPDQE